MKKACTKEVNQCLPCNDYPVENLSAEGEDLPTYLGFFYTKKDPDLGDNGETFSSEGCKGWAFSTISIEDAEAQAAAQDCDIEPEPDDDPDEPLGPSECLFPRCGYPDDELCNERPRLEVLATGHVVYCINVHPIVGYCNWSGVTGTGPGCVAISGTIYAFNNVDPINYDSWIARVICYQALPPDFAYCAMHAWDASGRPPEATYVLNDAFGTCVHATGFETSVNTPIQVTLEVPPP